MKIWPRWISNVMWPATLHSMFDTVLYKKSKQIGFANKLSLFTCKFQWKHTYTMAKMNTFSTSQGAALHRFNCNSLGTNSNTFTKGKQCYYPSYQEAVIIVTQKNLRIWETGSPYLFEICRGEVTPLDSNVTQHSFLVGFFQDIFLHSALTD